MQTVREFMKALRDVSCHGQRFSGGTLVAIRATQQLEFHGEHQHALADVVVQLASDSRSFTLLRSQQTSAQGAVSVVALSQLVLIRAQLCFCPLTASSLNQQTGNEYRLSHEQRESSEQVIAVAIPQRRFLKSDDRP
jgi:hypothetical protein